MSILKRYFFIGLSVVILIASCTPEVEVSSAPDPLRGAWVQDKSLGTKEGIDNVIRKAKQGGFKQIFVSVFEDGTVIYPNAVAEQSGGIELGFDPLSYIVEEAHQRGIQVHAWFVVGRVANGKGYSAVIEKHPDWGLVGPDGMTMPWLNFTHPDARKFISDIMMETVARGVDGIHFDYTRYPDSQWGFDEYSIRAFNSSHDFDLNELRYPSLPAYGLFESNALLQPVTAHVLARFSNGSPAVLLNQYGDGQALILNWKADQRKTAVGSEILKRGISSFLQAGGGVYIFRSEITIAQYGEQPLNRTMDWVGSLGWDHTVISSEEIESLGAGSVLILPNIYLFAENDAGRLERFVREGGSAIFIDGPTRSMNLDEMRAVTGMTPIRNYFKAWTLMTASAEHALIPVSEQPENIHFNEERNKQWVVFREKGINSLIEEVYRRVKAENPDVRVTVTITSDQKQARQVNLQDWQTWLREGYIDTLIPRAYEDTPEGVSNTLEKWRHAIERYNQLTFGLIVYTRSNGNDVQKTPEQLKAEIETVLNSGSNGFMIFDLDRMNEAQLDMLANFEP